MLLAMDRLIELPSSLSYLMLALRRRAALAVIILAALSTACTHPLEIVGEGDIISASGKRDCLLEDFQAGAETCTKNLVVGAYEETYMARPRQGWVFERWEVLCRDKSSDNCSFSATAETVRNFWGKRVPPLRAVFEPADYAADRYAPVEKTNQTQCWDTEGEVIDCAGTGQDGELRAGVPWPDPRFVDNGDGTVLDKLTGLIWLKNGNCLSLSSTRSEFVALLAKDLAAGQCDLTDNSQPGDWRIPTIAELISLIDVEQGGGIPQGHPFILFPENTISAFASGTYYKPRLSNVPAWWTFPARSRLNTSSNGILSSDNASGVEIYLLAVRQRNPATGDLHILENNGAAPVEITGQKSCMRWGERRWWNCGGRAVDGELQAGIPYPTPRFVDNRNGTITDRLTRLVWMLDYACFADERPTWAEALSTAKTFADGSCGISDGSVAGDWRVPNINELVSLKDLTDRQGFNKTLLGLQQPQLWSSTTLPAQPSWAYTVNVNSFYKIREKVTERDLVLVRDP